MLQSLTYPQSKITPIPKYLTRQMQQTLSTSTSPPFQKQAIFMLDSRDSKIPTYLFVAISPQGALEIVAARFKELSAEQLSFEASFDLVQIIGTQTYQSDRNLPKKLYMMRQIHKMYDYFTDEKNLVIRASIKANNGINKIILEPMVPVTKNIHEFVSLELDIIDQKYLTEFVNSKKSILKLILEQMQSDERERMEKLKVSQELEEKKRREQQEEEQKQTNSKQRSQGEIDWSQAEQIQKNQETSQSQHAEFQVVGSVHSNILLEEVNEDIQKIQLEGNNHNQGNCQKQQGQNILEENDSIDEYQNLQTQHIALLQERNEQLLKRVIELQTLLIKKSVRLQVYEQFQCDNSYDSEEQKPDHPKLSEDQIKKAKQSCAILERKYENQIHKIVQSTEELRILFSIMKKQILPNQANSKSSKTSKESINRKNINQVMDQIQEIFESL